MNYDIFPPPIQLLTDSITKFNPKLDDPLSFALKIWQNTICGIQSDEKPATSFEKTVNQTEILLTHFIQDYSIWHNAVDSIISAFCLSSKGRKTKISEYPFLKVITWWVFYNENQLNPGIIQFLGGHDFSRKQGFLQRTGQFLEWLAGNEKQVRLDLLAAFCEFYDINFVEENLLVRYDSELAKAFLLELEIPTKIPRGQGLTVPKSPYLRTSRKLGEKMSKYRLENIIREREEKSQEKIIYAKQIPTSTYIPDHVPAVQPKRETSIHEFNLSHQNHIKNYQKTYEDVMARVDSFHAKEMPDFSTQPDIKKTSNTIFREIANLKRKQQKILDQILSKQYGDDESYQRYIAEVELQKSIEEFEKSQGRILGAQFSFENAILASETLRKLKTDQTRKLKSKINKIEQKRKLDDELLLNQKVSNAEFLKQKLKSDVEASKKALFEKNLESVKHQTEQMQKLVTIALQKARKEFQEKQRMIAEIQDFEENLRQKMKDYRKEFDEFAIYGEGNLLCEMSLKEVQMRYVRMKEQEKKLTQKKKVEIKERKVLKERNMMDEYQKLKRFDEEERKREKVLKSEKVAVYKKSMEDFRSETLDLMRQKLEHARSERMKLKNIQ